MSSLNIKGGRNPDKLLTLKNSIQNFDIVCLQETQFDRKYEPLVKTRLRATNLCASNRDKKSKGSAIVSLNSQCIPSKTWKDKNGTIAMGIYKLLDQEIIVCSVYAPNLDSSLRAQEEYCSFLIRLDLMLENALEWSESIAILGDFNLVMDETLDCLGQMREKYKIIQEELQELLHKFALLDIYREKH